MGVSSGADPDSAHRQVAWVWDELDADGLGDAWQQLISWVLHESDAHGVSDRLPREWYLYSGLVAHLAVLREWQGVANRPSAHPREAAEWHEAFYRMVDFVWPRFTATSGLGRRSSGSADRVGEALRRHVEGEVQARRDRVETR